MVTPRKVEDGSEKPLIRSDRFFKLHNFWFFATREGAAVGPFDSKEGAVQAVADYIEFAKKADDETLRFFKTGTRYAV
ncbi:DUF6316 family protein [Porticoccus sp.]|uniref:DUF6316 family protein n=1 Tax=Porticoccus sp. TaxID=2024853 RepID=UPI003F69A7EC